MMGFKLKRIDNLKLIGNEERELIVTLEEENRAAIHGVVRFPGGAPAKNAVVKLFVKKGCNPCELIPVTFAFTDECGQFLFGVKSGIEYVIKVFWYTPEKHMEECKKPHNCEYDC